MWITRKRTCLVCIIVKSIKLIKYRHSKSYKLKINTFIYLYTMKHISSYIEAFIEHCTIITIYCLLTFNNRNNNIWQEVDISYILNNNITNNNMNINIYNNNNNNSNKVYYKCILYFILYMDIKIIHIIYLESIHIHHFILSWIWDTCMTVYTVYVYVK